MGMLADLGYPVPALRGSRYTAVAPVRVLDSRRGAPLGPGQVVDLQVSGANGVPSSATAVVLNVTGVTPTGTTDLRVYPTPVVGTGVPGTSSVNLAGGRTRANLVTVPLGAQGRVRLRNNSGSVHVLADLAGWYAPSGDATFTAADPVRVLDTRGRDGRRSAPAAGPSARASSSTCPSCGNGPGAQRRVGRRPHGDRGRAERGHRRARLPDADEQHQRPDGEQRERRARLGRPERRGRAAGPRRLGAAAQRGRRRAPAGRRGRLVRRLGAGRCSARCRRPACWTPGGRPRPADRVRSWSCPSRACPGSRAWRRPWS